MSTSGAEIARAYVTAYVKMPGLTNDVTKFFGAAPVKKAVQKEGATLGGSLSKAISNGYKSSKGFVPDIISGFKDARAAASSFTGVGATVGAALRKGMDPGINAAQRLVSGFNDSHAAASSFSGFAGSLGGTLRKAMDPGITQVQNLVSGFNDSTAAASSFSGFAGTVGGAIRRGLDPAIGWSQNFISGFKDADAAASSFTGRAGELGGMAARAWEKVSGAAQSMGGQIGRVWTGVQDAASNAFNGVRNAALSLTDQLGGIFDKVAIGAGAAFGALLGVAGVKGWDRLVTIEDSTAALGITMGDTASAAKLLDDVMGVVTGTGYNFDQFAAAASTLAGFGVEGEKIPGYLTAIGEAAATKGKNANEFAERLTTQFGQMAAVGQVSMSDIWRLADVGVNGLTILGNHFGVTTDEMKTMISSGTVPAQEAMDALTKGIMEGSAGAAGSTKALEGTMESLRGTTSGVVGGLMSSFARFGAGAIAPLMPLVKDLAVQFTEWMDEVGPKVGDFLGDLVGWISANKEWIGPVVVGLGSMVGVIGTIIAVTKTWRAVQFALNVVMSANPLGAIISLIAGLVAGLIYFFTQTETGKKVWAAIVEAFRLGWEQIKAGFTFLVEAFALGWEQIKTGFQWVVDTFALGWEAMKMGLTAVRDFFVGIWTSITDWVGQKIAFVKLVITVGVWAIRQVWNNVWSTIRNFFVNIWTSIVTWVATKINQAKAIIAVVTTAIRVGWSAVWNGIKTFFVNLWNSIISWIAVRIEAMRLVIALGIEAMRRVWTNVWNAIKSVVSTVWSSIKSTVQTLIDFIKTKPAAAFEAAKNGIVTAWNKIKEAAKKPIRFVVQTAIGGLVDALNKIPLVNITKPKLPPGFRTGGYTGNAGLNEVAGVVHGREHVTRAESTAKLNRNHPGLLDHMNRYGTLPGYRKGGWVTPLPAGSYSVSQPFHSGHNGIDLAAATGTKVMAPAAGKVVQAGWEPGGSFGGGNQVNILHPGNILTWFAHLSTIAARVGQQVSKGRTLGGVGSTGNSTGPHLHYMIETGSSGALGSGTWINPAPYMTGHTTPEGGVGDKSGWNPLAGIVDWVSNKIKDAFPDGGMFVDAALGLAKDTAQKAVDKYLPKWGKDDTGSAFAPMLYDDGGLLQPGLTLTNNKTGRPEPILTGAQWDSLLSSRASGSSTGVFHLYDTDGRLFGTMRGIAEDAIDDANEDAERTSRLVRAGGV